MGWHGMMTFPPSMAFAPSRRHLMLSWDMFTIPRRHYGGGAVVVGARSHMSLYPGTGDGGTPVGYLSYLV